MQLVISEKNIAARRIAEILAVGKPTTDKVYTTSVYRFRRDGEDWVSIGLKGHIMKVDFPEDHSKWKLATLNDLVHAEVLKLPSEKGIIRSISNLAKKADHVYVATDYDREGELIGADARSVVRDVNADVPIDRVRFSAITRTEIEEAFSEPGKISDDLAEAGGTRQDIDLIWGAVLTRYLTLTSNKAQRRAWGDILSAGRVQTPTLKLIVDREGERDAFVSETYWTVKGRCAKDSDEFAVGHATERFKDLDEAQRALAAANESSSATVSTVKKKKRTIKPPAPFNTTSLLAAASSIGFAPARTMRIAETLYMNGYMSYPRVDNTVYPPSLDLKGILKALDAVPIYHEHVTRLLGKGELTPTRGKKQATDHPPIHPTAAADPEKLKADEFKLYNLVARRFMATLSDPAVLESTRVELDVAGERFVAKGDVTVSPGFHAVYHYGLRKEELLPTLAEGNEVRFLGAEMEEKQTQPPARFSQGKLIQEMEKLGLGTKATRHNIIQTLYDRKYAAGDPIEPTCKGKTVVEALVDNAARITTPEMTAELEDEMDQIANAQATRGAVVTHSRSLLAEVMEKLLARVDEVGEILKVAADEDAKVGICPKSGDDLLIKYSPKTKGYFVGCSGYPECDVTYRLPQAMRYESVEEPCPECGTIQVMLHRFKSKPLVRCLNLECPTNYVEETDLGACPVCAKEGRDGRITRRVSPKSLKQYARCTLYDTCGVSYPLPQSGEVEATGETCDPCGSPKVVVTTRKGPWKICLDPDCETKAKSKSRSKSKGKSKSKRAKGSKSKPKD